MIMVKSGLLQRLPVTALIIVLSGFLSWGIAMSEQADAALARNLAARIIAVAGRLDLSRITVRDGSHAETPETTEFQRTLEAELRRLGFTTAQDPATGATIEVTVSAAFQGIVAVAEIRSGDAKSVALALQSHGPQAAASDQVTPVTLQLHPLIMRPEPILDVLPVQESLLVLGTENLVLQRAAGSDSDRQVATVTHTQPWPRDPRGRLWTDGATVRAYLPGTRCQGTLRPLALACADSQEPWPLDGGDATLAAGRNYFEASGIRPFYSMVPPGPAADGLRLIAGIDGKSYLYNSNQDTLAILDGLGSDLASLHSGCGSGAQILVALPGDQGTAGFLQAFEWINRQPRPASSPMPVSGCITALWPAPDMTSVILIAHNSEAGRYEAYRVSVACSR